MYKIFFFFSLCLCVYSPLVVEASIPSQVSSAFVESGLYSISVETESSSAGVIKNANQNPLLVSSVSSGTKQTGFSVANKTKKFKDSKSGVSLVYPTKPVYTFTKKNVGKSDPSFGYLVEANIKGSSISSSLGLVSHGVLGLIGWDSVMYGAKSSFYDIRQKNLLKLPVELLPKLVEKKEYITLDQYKVEHNYIEYQGIRVLGMYSGLTEINGVMIGLVTTYADPSLVSTKSGKQELLTEKEAKEMLVTVLDKSVVETKKANKYFKISN